MATLTNLRSEDMLALRGSLPITTKNLAVFREMKGPCKERVEGNSYSESRPNRSGTQTTLLSATEGKEKLRMASNRKNSRDLQKEKGKRTKPTYPLMKRGRLQERRRLSRRFFQSRGTSDSTLVIRKKVSHKKKLRGYLRC